MNERRLYDKTGPKDPEIDRLEELLRPCGWAEGAPLRAVPPAAVPRRAFLGAAAAVLCLCLGGGYAAWRLAAGTSSPPPAGDGPVAVAPVVSAGGAALAAGEWVSAGDARREMSIGKVGLVTLEPGSRVRVSRVAADETRLYLERGRLEALIAADVKPRFFQIDTDAGRCVDLGCRYVLAAEPDGTARVRVLTGRVVFEAAARELYVPAGAACVARRGASAGTPRFEDTPEALAEAIDAFDGAHAAPAQHRRALAAAATALATTPRDTLPLWHWLQDDDEDVRLTALASLEAHATRPARLADPARPWSRADRELWRRELSRGW